MINKGNKGDHFDEPALACQLFEKLGEEGYKDKSFLEVASEFITVFGNKLDSAFNEKYWIPHRDECIECLVGGKGQSHEQEARKKIIEYLKKNSLYELTDETNEFINLNEKHIDRYQKALSRLQHKYDKGKGKNLIYALQLIGTTEDISLIDHYFHNIESIRGTGCLIFPSHIHYFSNAEGTVFIYIKTKIQSWRSIQQLLEKHQPKVQKIYLFTLEVDLQYCEIANFKFFGMILVTTHYIRNKHYSKNEDVITLEEGFKLCKLKQNYGDNHKLSKGDKRNFDDALQYQISFFSQYECKRLKNGYKQQLEKLNESEYKSLEEIINGDGQ